MSLRRTSFLLALLSILSLSALNAAPWTAGASIPVPTTRYAHVQVGNDLYLITGSSSIPWATWVYNATADSWSRVADIPFGSEAPPAAYMDGKIYVSSGGAGQMMIYDIATDSWSSGAFRGITSYGAAAGAYNGKVYVVGGAPSGHPVATTSIYDVATDSWSTAPDAPARFGLGGFVQDGQYLYLVGSFGYMTTVNSTSTLRLDLASGNWSSGPDFTAGRADGALAFDGVKLYLIGGDATGGGYFDSTADVDELDVSAWPAGTWQTSADPLPSPRQGNSAGYFSTGRSGGEIWSTGGLYGPTFAYLDEHVYRSTGANTPPVAVCKAAFTLSADSNCSAMLTAEQVDDGSWDAEGEVTLALDDYGPFELGPHLVTLTVTDQNEATATCQTTVTVEDTTSPVVTIKARPRPTKIGRPITVDVTGTAADNCHIASASMTVTDSEGPNLLTDVPVMINGDGTYSTRFTVPATRYRRRSHVYKVYLTVVDDAGNTTTVDVAIPIT